MELKANTTPDQFKIIEDQKDEPDLTNLNSNFKKEEISNEDKIVIPSDFEGLKGKKE